MEQTYTITVDLTPALYGEATLLAKTRGRTLNQLIVEALESMLQATQSDCMLPECPDTAPEWDNRLHRR